MDEDSEAKVSMFIDEENHLWREDVLENYLFDFEAENCQIYTFVSDTTRWCFNLAHNLNGEYTAKSGYNFLGQNGLLLFLGKLISLLPFFPN